MATNKNEHGDNVNASRPKLEHAGIKNGKTKLPYDLLSKEEKQWATTLSDLLANKGFRQRSREDQDGKITTVAISKEMIKDGMSPRRIAETFGAINKKGHINLNKAESKELKTDRYKDFAKAVVQMADEKLIKKKEKELGGKTLSDADRKAFLKNEKSLTDKILDIIHQVVNFMIKIFDIVSKVAGQDSDIGQTMHNVTQATEVAQNVLRHDTTKALLKDGAKITKDVGKIFASNKKSLHHNTQPKASLDESMVLRTNLKDSNVGNKQPHSKRGL